MKLIRGLYNLDTFEKGCVATIGNFDGVHIGHQQLLSVLKQKAGEVKLPTVVVLFEPQPFEYFADYDAPARLTKLRGKLVLLKEMGVDYVLCLRFNQALIDLPPEVFVQQILVDKLKVSAVMIGDDFRFGQRRRGDFALLQRLAQQHHFDVTRMPTVECLGGRVSSTRIRHALASADMELAATFLGRPFTMAGRVAHGDKRGRLIGFPTANIYLHRKSVPLSGVFIVIAHGIRNESVKGVANIGNRPTVDGTRSLLEVHLFDFDQDIYGKHVRIEFIKKLRDEKRYDSFEILKEQIFKDAKEAKEYFGL